MAEDAGPGSGDAPGGRRKGLTRRRLLDWFLGTSVGALLVSIGYPVIRFISPPRVPEATTRQVEAGSTNAPQLMKDGYEIIRFGSEPVIVIRLSETDIRAFTATCTHLACIVEYQRKEERIYCNCHGGGYDLKGRNVAGPPPRPLTPLKVSLVAGSGGAQTIIVSRS